MHELVQAFVKESLRPIVNAVAELPGYQPLEDLRGMLIAAAKGTIDAETDKRRVNPGTTLGPKGNATPTKRGILTMPTKKIIV